MNLESQQITLGKSSQEVFDFLSNVENFEKIMPENTDTFKVNGDSFTFALKGMPEIELALKETEAPKKIVLGSTNDKFPFSLKADIEDAGAEQSAMQLKFEGSFNPMVAMMVKKPLQKFIDTLSENIGKL